MVLAAAAGKSMIRLVVAALGAVAVVPEAVPAASATASKLAVAGEAFVAHSAAAGVAVDHSKPTLAASRKGRRSDASYFLACYHSSSSVAAFDSLENHSFGCLAVESLAAADGRQLELHGRRAAAALAPLQRMMSR